MNLTIAAYAERHGKSTRTVQRWLERGLLPGAEIRGGVWQIPGDVLPLEDARAGAIATRSSEGGAPPATLAGALDVLPGYLDVPTAARLLGITEHAVLANARELGGRRWGERGRWVIPARTIRTAAGLQ